MSDLDFSAIVYATDLDSSDQPTDPGLPVIWLTPHHGRTMPFGEIVVVTRWAGRPLAAHAEAPDTPRNQPVLQRHGDNMMENVRNALPRTSWQQLAWQKAAWLEAINATSGYDITRQLDGLLDWIDAIQEMSEMNF